MTRRGAATRTVASIGAVAAACLGGAAAADAATPRQVGGLTYTSTAPGAPTGTVLHLEFQNPEDPSLKPHAVARMVVHRAPGSVIDTTVPPQCRASDAELLARGPAACPPETQIGSAVMVSDTGGRDPFPRYSRTNISNFNNQDEVIGVGVNESLPVTPFDRTKIEGERTTTNFPVFPGAPPPEPFMAIKTLHLEVPTYVRDGRTYNRTPPTCPAVGYWTIKLDFTYRDGVTETVESRSPCRQPRAHRAKKKKKSRPRQGRPRSR